MKIPSKAELVPLYYVCLDVMEMDEALRHCVPNFFDSVVRRATTRGWEDLLLVDLPTMGTLLDGSMSHGSILSNGFPASMGTKRNLWKSWIYRDLLHLVWDTFGQFDSECPPEVVFGIRQLLFLYKKFRVGCPEENIKSAVEEFYQIESELRPPSGHWLWNHWSSNGRHTFDSSIWPGKELLPDRYWRTLDQVFARLVPQREVSLRDISPKHGPGAVSDVREGADKYQFPHWPSKLEGLYPYSEFGSVNCELVEGSPHLAEPPSKLIAVPKTYKGPRLIASEPVAHQFIQQGLMSWIRNNLTNPMQRVYSPRSQEPNRVAAFLGSVHTETATIDLSSASDRLSCWTVERAFSCNQSLLEALHACRTRSLVDGTRKSDEGMIILLKFAPQGSAVTFPVQSIIYAGFAIASMLIDAKSKVTSKSVAACANKVRVYGDDIIMPSSSVVTMEALLRQCQLKVNGKKSHIRGQYRESCGMDAYCGHDVTPLYIADALPPTMDSPKHLASWLDISNLAHEKGLWRLADWMLRNMPMAVRKRLIVSSEQGGFRAKSFCSGYTSAAKRRYNKALHRVELRTYTIRDSSEWMARGSWQSLLQWFVEEPEPDTKWSSGWLTKKASKRKLAWVPAPINF